MIKSILTSIALGIAAFFAVRYAFPPDVAVEQLSNVVGSPVSYGSGFFASLGAQFVAAIVTALLSLGGEVWTEIRLYIAGQIKRLIIPNYEPREFDTEALLAQLLDRMQPQLTDIKAELLRELLRVIDEKFNIPERHRLTDDEIRKIIEQLTPEVTAKVAAQVKPPARRRA